LVVTAPVGLGRIHLVPIDMFFRQVEDAVAQDKPHGDVGIGAEELGHDVALRLGVLPDSRLMALRLGSTSRVVCGSPAYLGLHGTPAAPEDVAGHDCILCESFQAPEVWTFALGQADMTIAIRPRLVRRE
jgi:DNA-binding transcriptional LysR family regulator